MSKSKSRSRISGRKLQADDSLQELLRLPPFKAEPANTKPESVDPQFDASLSSLGNFLLSSLRVHSVSEHSFDNAITVGTVIQTYQKNRQLLQDLRQEWSTFLATLLQIEFASSDDTSDVCRQQAAEEIEQWRTELARYFNLDFTSLPNPVSAELTSLPLAEVRNRLIDNIEQEIVESKNSMLRSLATLVEQDIIGLIRWYDKANCAYDRLVRSVVVEQLSTRNESEVVGVKGLTVTRSHKSIIGGTLQRHKQRTTQHLTHAEETNLDLSRHIIPPKYLLIVRSIPAWILPATKFVDGHIIRETQVVQDLDRRDWQRVGREWLEVKDEVLWKYDPAITLGPFVITSWGSLEIQEVQKEGDFLETVNDSQLIRTQSVSSSSVISFIMGFAVLIIGVFLLASSQMGWAGQLAGVLFLFLSAILIYRPFSAAHVEH